jgi:transglutaminase-like putative cysteine protease
VSRATLPLFLRASDLIDWETPSVRELAAHVAAGHGGEREIARACFEWVRDRIPHTGDHLLDPITCSASEVIARGTGFCYAKSHLLAALLRANGIPAGLVYQRLGNEDGSFCLHGLNAVWLSDTGWYRLDARGTRPDLVAEFVPPREVLPYAGTAAGEVLFPDVWPEPVGIVVDALRRHRTREELLRHLPDAEHLEGTTRS